MVRRDLGKGIMGYWDIGKMGKNQKTQTQHFNIPTFHYSNIPMALIFHHSSIPIYLLCEIYVICG